MNYSMREQRLSGVLPRCGLILVLVSICMPFTAVGQMPIPLFRKPPEVYIHFMDGTVKQHSIGGFFDPRVDSIESTELTDALRVPFIEFNTARGRLALKLPRIRALSTASPVVIDVFSGSDVTCYSLGNVSQYVPDPPDWYKPGGETSQWEPVDFAHPNHSWYHVPGSSWIWSSSSWGSTTGEIVLFRQKFDVPKNLQVVDAEIMVTADHQVEVMYLNGYEIDPLRKSLIGSCVTYNVRSLIIPGLNLFALKAKNERNEEVNFAGIAWRVRIRGIQGVKDASRAEAPGAVAIALNGDRISGTISQLSPESVIIKTEYAQVPIALSWTRRLLINYHVETTPGEPAEKKKKGFLTRIFTKEASPDAPQVRIAHPPFAWSEDNLDGISTDFVGVLLKDSREIKSVPIGLHEQLMYIQTDYGQQTAISLDKIKALYLTPQRKSGFLRFKEPDLPYVCNAILLNGDRISGIIESIEPTFLEIATPYAGIIRISFDRLLRCEFPMNVLLSTTENVKKWSEVKNRSFNIGILGDPIGTTPYRTEEARELYNNLYRSLVQMQLEPEQINALKLIEPEVLSPERMDLLVNIDAREHYYYSVKSPGDGHAALMKYINEGGNLLIMGSGVPFYYGYTARQGEWLTITRGEEILTPLGFDVVLPGEFNPQAQSFELPENPVTTLKFKRIMSQVDPAEISLLPEEVPFPPSADSRFRPVVPGNLKDNDQFFSIYELVDSNGKRWGPAMAILKRQSATGRRQTFIYVSYQLARARINGQDFVDYLMPVAIQSLINR